MGWNPLETFSDDADVREKRPVGRSCPNCGNTDYTPVDTHVVLGFVPDRECKSCRTIYHPPPPLIASVVLVIFGALAFLMVLPLLVIILSTVEFGRRRGGGSLFCVGVLMFVAIGGGLLALGTGGWGLYQYGRAK